MADTLDVLTLTEAKTATGVSGSTLDTPLALAVTAVSRQLDKLCGPIVTRNATVRRDGGGCIINIPAPVLTFTTVTEYAGTAGTVLTAETNAAKSANDYLYDGTLGVLGGNTMILRRRANGWDATFAVGRQNIEIVHARGRAANTAGVDPKFKQAAAMMLRNIWTSEMASGTQTFEAFDEQVTNLLLGPGMLNKVAGLLTGEMLDAVYVG